jgi:hypothetical protein
MSGIMRSRRSIASLRPAMNSTLISEKPPSRIPTIVKPATPPLRRPILHIILPSGSGKPKAGSVSPKSAENASFWLS